MLILSRKRGETVCIGNSVTFRVLDISPGKVRIGICAPKALPVHREEVYERLKAEAEDAVSAGIPHARRQDP